MAEHIGGFLRACYRWSATFPCFFILVMPFTRSEGPGRRAWLVRPRGVNCRLWGARCAADGTVELGAQPVSAGLQARAARVALVSGLAPAASSRSSRAAP